MRILFFLLINCIAASAQVERYSVLIHEIMADPSPIVGLPNAEYVELRNTSSQPIELFRWKIDNGTTTATISSYYLLLPDSTVLLCSRSQLPFFSGVPNCIGLNALPSLSNAGDRITLRSSDGKTIHAVEYTLSMYGNAVKAAGGWSLEMIDRRQPCHPENWTASIHPSGGTPGKLNSRNGTTLQPRNNVVLQCTALSDKLLEVEWEFPMDSLSLAHAPNYFFDSTAAPIRNAVAVGSLFKSVRLELARPLDSQRLYTLRTNPIWHCRTVSKQSFSVRTGLPQPPRDGDVVINELLFDPPPEGSDYIELLNRSSSMLDLRQLAITAPDPVGRPTTIVALADRSINFFPGEHLVFTTDTGYLLRRWTSAQRTHLFQLKSMPTLPDNEGRIAVLNLQGHVLDQVQYTASMHAPLIQHREGVALERIRADRPSTEAANWHSAASSSGYGTPTLKNSQSRTDSATVHPFSVQPDLLSPDNDGVHDFIHIAYAFKEAGHMLTASVFNRQGLMVTTIIDNQLCGTAGAFNWNGTDANGRLLPRGVYILLIETFHPSAKNIRYKKGFGIR